MTEWTGVSIASVRRSLRLLIDRGLIEQVYHSADNREVHYKAYINPRVKMTLAQVKLTQPSGQNDPSLGSNVTEPRVKMTRAIKDDNKLDNKTDNKADSRP